MVNVSDKERSTWEKLAIKKDIVHLCAENQRKLKESYLLLQSLKKKNLVSKESNEFTVLYKQRGSLPGERATYATPGNRNPLSPRFIGGKFHLFWTFPVKFHCLDDRIYVKKILKSFENPLRGGLSSDVTEVMIWVREKGIPSCPGHNASWIANWWDGRLRTENNPDFDSQYLANWSPMENSMSRYLPDYYWNNVESCIHVMLGGSDDMNNFAKLSSIRKYIRFVHESLDNLEILNRFGFIYRVLIPDLPESRFQGVHNFYAVKGRISIMNEVRNELTVNVQREWRRNI